MADHDWTTLLDDLSLSLVMVDPSNLMALGELLEKLERLAQDFPNQRIPKLKGLIPALIRSVEAVILEQAPHKEQALERVGEGLALLQDAARNMSADRPFDADSEFLAKGLLEDAGITWNSTEAPAVSNGAPEALLQPSQAVSNGRTTAYGAETPSAAAKAFFPDLDSIPPLGGDVPRKPAGDNAPSLDIGYDPGQDRELFFSFISESLEHIEAIEVSLISLEQNPQDLETINAVFRPFHTIKGVSGFLNLKHIHGLTHNVENLLDDARNERLQVGPSLIDLVLDSVDILKRMIHDVREAMNERRAVPTEYDVGRITDRIKAIQQGESAEAEEAEESPYAGRKLGEILIEQGLLDESELSEIVHAQQSSRLRRLGDLIVDKGIISQESLETALRLQMKDQSKKLGEILVETGLAAPTDVSRVIHEQEMMREQKLGEMLIRGNRAGVREVTAALREQRKAPEGAGALGQTVKVDTLKLDGLVDLMGELVIAQSLVSSNERIRSLKDPKIQRDLSHMTRITSELQRTAMSMRMVQIRQTFQKMIRLVRDLSRKSGKQVDLDMTGEETEIDRNMVEAIYDPLVHMVRNSVDHGLEPPAQRAQAGKSPEGRITLRAFHQGGNVVIQIEDDGRGLNRERILAKALEKGLVDAQDNLPDGAVYQLVFQPGFSTAEQVTDVSGRGVGMDVVKKAIDKLRGKIEIASRPGQGSTFTIRLPLTLAIIDGMIVQVGDQRYILPTVAIHESFRPGAGDYHTVQGQGEMVRVRQSLLPLVRLDQILGARSARTEPTEALMVVVENEGQRRCLMVDQVLGKQEVVIKSLGERLKHVRALAGGSILGDGTVGLILDVAGIFELADGGHGFAAPARASSGSDWDMAGDWGMGEG